MVHTDTKHFQFRLRPVTHNIHPQARCRCGTATLGGAAREPGRPSPGTGTGGNASSRQPPGRARGARAAPAPHLRRRGPARSGAQPGGPRPRGRRLRSEPRPDRPPIAPAWPPAQGPMAERVAPASLRRARLALPVTAFVPGPGARVRLGSAAAWPDGASAEGRNKGARGQRSGRAPEPEQVAARRGRARAAAADWAVEWAGRGLTGRGLARRGVGWGRRGVVCRGGAGPTASHAGSGAGAGGSRGGRQWRPTDPRGA